MKPSTAFLDEVRTHTIAHLRALSAETGQVFANYLAAGPVAVRLYERLVELYAMDGAQGLCARLIEIASGELEHGAVFFTAQEYEGLCRVRDEFGSELPESLDRQLRELLTILAKAGTAR